MGCACTPVRISDQAGAAANVVLALPSRPRPAQNLQDTEAGRFFFFFAFSWMGASAASSFRTLSSRGWEWLAPVVWRINRQGCVAVCPGSSLSAPDRPVSATSEGLAAPSFLRPHQPTSPVYGSEPSFFVFLLPRCIPCCDRCAPSNSPLLSSSYNNSHKRLFLLL